MSFDFNIAWGVKNVVNVLFGQAVQKLFLKLHIYILNIYIVYLQWKYFTMS